MNKRNLKSVSKNQIPYLCRIQKQNNKRVSFLVVSVFAMVAALFYIVVLLEYAGNWTVKRWKQFRKNSRDDKTPKCV